MDDQLIESIEYYDNGMEKIRMSYQDGLLNGFYTEYNDNGDYIMEGQYRKGLKNGVWSYYNAEGYRFKTEKYYMGKLLKSKTFEPEMY
jgi:antitoxin component YwqK of YwqJK toxin-antitoxin module